MKKNYLRFSSMINSTCIYIFLIIISMLIIKDNVTLQLLVTIAGGCLFSILPIVIQEKLKEEKDNEEALTQLEGIIKQVTEEINFNYDIFHKYYENKVYDKLVIQSYDVKPFITKTYDKYYVTIDAFRKKDITDSIIKKLDLIEELYDNFNYINNVVLCEIDIGGNSKKSLVKLKEKKCSFFENMKSIKSI